MTSTSCGSPPRLNCCYWIVGPHANPSGACGTVQMSRACRPEHPRSTHRVCCTIVVHTTQVRPRGGCWCCHLLVPLVGVSVGLSVGVSVGNAVGATHESENDVISQQLCKLCVSVRFICVLLVFLMLSHEQTARQCCISQLRAPPASTRWHCRNPRIRSQPRPVDHPRRPPNPRPHHVQTYGSTWCRLRCTKCPVTSTGPSPHRHRMPFCMPARMNAIARCPIRLCMLVLYPGSLRSQHPPPRCNLPVFLWVLRYCYSSTAPPQVRPWRCGACSIWTQVSCHRTTTIPPALYGCRRAVACVSSCPRPLPPPRRVSALAVWEACATQTCARAARP